ncbi:MAG: hypothetical protein R2873_13530 [Caldilineaceae bacterium]
MNGQQPLANQEGPSQPNHYSSFILSSFFTFRLFFIPTFTLTHAAHGPLWISLVLGLVLTFGGEWLARRRIEEADNPRRDLLVVIASLFLIGLFPEETPIQLILWAGISLAWGRCHSSRSMVVSSTAQWIGYVVGAAVGITGLIGPGSWIMGLLLTVCVVRSACSLSQSSR